MCSFSCWLVFQSLVVSASCSMFWALQSMLIKHRFTVLLNDVLSRAAHRLSFWLLFLFCFSSQPKEAFSPWHVYRVRWHVCCSLRRKYSGFTRFAAQRRFSMVNGRKVKWGAQMMIGFSCLCRAPEWEQQVSERTSRRTPTSGTTGPMLRVTTVSASKCWKKHLWSCNVESITVMFCQILCMLFCILGSKAALFTWIIMFFVSIFRGKHWWDIRQALWCLRLHRPGCV